MKTIIFLFACLALLSVNSCSEDTSSDADVSVYLHDAPDSAYQKIKIELKAVAIYSQASGSWVTLTVENGIFDLLTLDSMHQQFLGKLKLQGGDITDLQLTIGSQNTITVSGIDHPLILDPSDLDKLKVKINNKLKGGTSYKLSIDFKAKESIDQNGNVYKLKASLKISIKEI